MSINEDMIEVMTHAKEEVMRDLRVCSIAVVVAVNDKMVDVQLMTADVSNGTLVVPPVVKNLHVVGSKGGLLSGNGMPDVGDHGVVLHFDRKNFITGSMEISGGPAHEIGYGVFLPILS